MTKPFTVNPKLDFALERFIDAPTHLVWEAVTTPEHLPEWYMPAIASGTGRVHGWRRATVFTFIAALLVIEAFGLCSTYGQFI